MEDRRIERSGSTGEKTKMDRHEAYFTFDEEALKSHGLRLYYFAPAGRPPGPYRTQVHVQAIIDIAEDGTLAGVELISGMPLPPSERKLATPRSGQSNQHGE